MANSYHDVGVVYKAQGKDEKALDHYKKSLEITIQVYGQDYPRVADSKYGRARVYEKCNEN